MTIYTSQNSSNERRQEKTRLYVTAAESSPGDDVTAEKQQCDEKLQMLPLMRTVPQQQHLQLLCKLRRWANVYLFNVCVVTNKLCLNFFIEFLDLL